MKETIINAKKDIDQNISLSLFGNAYGQVPGEGPPLPALSHGCKYVEFQVGSAHAGDPKRAGRRRLVFEVHVGSRKVKETYYTEDHYAKFTFYRIV